MIFDVEGATRTYLIDNMTAVVGHGNSSIKIYRRTFTAQAPSEAVSIYAELVQSHDSMEGDLQPTAIRINVRSATPKRSFMLAANIDKIFDKRYHTNLNDDVELCECTRNSGPSPFVGEGDHLHYNTLLYSCTFRYRGND